MAASAAGSAGAADRPVSVTVAVVVTWVSAIIEVVGGVVLLVVAGSDSVQESTGQSAAALRWLAVFILIIGLVIASIAAALARGSSLARLVVTVFQLVAAGGAVWSLFAVGTQTATESITTIVVAFVALALLWNARANAYFN